MILYHLSILLQHLIDVEMNAGHHGGSMGHPGGGGGGSYGSSFGGGQGQGGQSRYMPGADDDDAVYGSGGSFRIPDKDVYRRMLTSFGTVHNYFHQRNFVRCSKDRRYLQPHFNSLKDVMAPFANTHNPADGVCSHFLRRGLIKPHKTQMTSAVWSTDARWLMLGTVTGDLALWEGDALKVDE
jgi:hypothetical protein